MQAAAARVSLLHCVLALLAFCATRASGQATFCAGTLVGPLSPFVPQVDGTPATAVFLNRPMAVATTRTALIIADNSRVLALQPDGRLYAVAGNGQTTWQAYTDEGANAVDVALQPVALAVHPQTQDLLIVDAVNQAVRRVYARNGTLVTVAGSGVAGYGCSGCAASSAELNSPTAVMWTAAGDAIIGDGGNGVIRMVAGAVGSSGIATVMGIPGLVQPDDNDLPTPARNVTLGASVTMATDATSNVTYVGDGSVIHAVVNGTVTRVAGKATCSPPMPTLNGSSALDACFASAIVCDARNGVLLLLDAGFSVALTLHVNSGMFTTVAGNYANGYSGDGGPATLASLHTPVDCVFTDGGDVVIADSVNNAIRIVSALDGTIRTLAGAPDVLGDGSPGTAVSLRGPSGVLVAATSGLVLVADALHGRVRAWDPVTGFMSTVAGGASGSAEPGGNGGDARNATFAQVHALAWDVDGSLLISDVVAAQVRRVSAVAPAGTLISLVVGSSASCSPTAVGEHVPATSACLCSPTGLTVGPDGTLYIADPGVHRIRRVLRSASGAMVVVTFAGGGNSTGEGFAANATALVRPQHIVFNGDDAFIAVEGENRVYKVLPNGTLCYAVNAAGGRGGTGDGGAARNATLSGPVALAMNGGLLFIVERVGNRVRAVNVTSSLITTVVGGGTGACSYSGDGGPATSSTVCAPLSIAFDAFGNALVASSVDGHVRIFANNASGAVTVNCPAGYACACGTPSRCNDTFNICPADSVAPFAATPGYVAQPELPANDTLHGHSGQAICAAGSVCFEGARIPCPAGTYGTLEGLSSVTACATCPAGMYGFTTGSTSMEQACVPCPPGSYANTTGAAFCAPCAPGFVAPAPGVATCTPCTSGSWSLHGSAACTPVALSEVVTSVTVCTLQLPQSDGSVAAVKRARTIQLLVSIPIAVLALLPLLVAAALEVAGERAVSSEGGSVALSARLLRCLRAADRFSMHHWVADGGVVVKRRTSLGGALSCTSVGAVGALGAALVVQWLLNNTLQQQSLLMPMLSLLSGAGGVSVALAGSDVNSQASVLLPPLRGGVMVTLSSMGTPCAQLQWSRGGLIAGDFSVTTVQDPVSGGVMHAFDCMECVFGPVSTLSMQLPSVCQSLSVVVGTVGALGDVTLASFAAAMDAGGAEGQSLSALDASVQMTLQLVEDRVTGAQQRGYTLAVRSVSNSSASATDGSPVTVTLALPSSSSYVSIQRTPLTSGLQLLSAIMGLLGVLGAFATTFTIIDMFRKEVPAWWGHCCTRKERVQGSGVDSEPIEGREKVSGEGSVDASSALRVNRRHVLNPLQGVTTEQFERGVSRDVAAPAVEASQSLRSEPEGAPVIMVPIALATGRVHPWGEAASPAIEMQRRRGVSRQVGAE